MDAKTRGGLIDLASLWILLGVVLAAVFVRDGLYLLLPFASLPIRWGLVRVVAACRPDSPPPATLREKPFGYEQGGSVR